VVQRASHTLLAEMCTTWTGAALVLLVLLLGGGRSDALAAANSSTNGSSEYETPVRCAIGVGMAMNLLD